jgi:PII-like signaling protein
MAVQVTLYLNEADQWHRKPLYLEILNFLRKENVSNAAAIHAVAGFTEHAQVQTAHLVDVASKLPVVLTFVDSEEHLGRLVPTLREMAPHRLIVRQSVVVEQGTLE